MAPKKTAGRPAVPGDKRDKLTAFYLTPSDFEKLRKCADIGGFKGTSTLLTAIIEPIIQGGFSIASAARALNRVQKYSEANGLKFDVSWRAVVEGARDLFAPPPPIPDDVEDLSQLKADLRALLAELEKPKTKQPTPTK